VSGDLRLLRDSDDELARADELLMRAYASPSRRRELTLYLRAQPDGWYVIADGRELLAIAGCLLYGPFCWIGLVATHPSAQGRGLASRLSAHLVEWSLARGCRTVALDASDAGRPVYERLGFRAIGTTAELIRSAGAPPPPGDTAERGSQVDLEEIVAFDRMAFGGDRRALLVELAADEESRWHVTREEDGRLAGYLLGRSQGPGPGAATDERSARRLVRSAIDPSEHQKVLVPDVSSYLEVFETLGFVEQRRLTHMRFGELELPGERRRLLAQRSYATG
jgi:GNAT superfamily N-acetyltransferase